MPQPEQGHDLHHPAVPLVSLSGLDSGHRHLQRPCLDLPGNGPPSAVPLRLLVETRVAAQDRGLVGALPGEVGVFAAEVAVGRGLLVDGPQQLQVADDGRRTQVEVLRTSSSMSAGSTCSVPKQSTITLTGWATPMA